VSSVTQKNPVRLFVCHLWRKEDYLRVFEYLESAPNFFYTNTSTPESPEGRSRNRSRGPAQADFRSRVSSCRRRYTGETSTGSVGEFAKAFDKPLVLLEPFGGQDTSRRPQDLADEPAGISVNSSMRSSDRRARGDDALRHHRVRLD
jgi:hypothetical protein